MVCSEQMLDTNRNAITKVSLRGVPRFVGRRSNLAVKDEIAALPSVARNDNCNNVKCASISLLYHIFLSQGVMACS